MAAMEPIVDVEIMQYINEITNVNGPIHTITPINVINYCDANQIYYDTESQIQQYFMIFQGRRYELANDEETRENANYLIEQFNNRITTCDIYLEEDNDTDSLASTIVNDEYDEIYINVSNNNQDIYETPPITPIPESPVIAPEWMQQQSPASPFLLSPPSPILHGFIEGEIENMDTVCNLRTPPHEIFPSHSSDIFSQMTPLL